MYFGMRKKTSLMAKEKKKKHKKQLAAESKAAPAPAPKKVLTNEQEPMDKEQLSYSWQEKLHEIIFEADTPAGKRFDVVLLWLILISILVVMLESVREIEAQYGDYLTAIEWIITVLFTAEFFARVVSIGKPSRYVFSFYGIIDLLAILPTYLTLIITGSQYLLVIRAIRLLRVFRVLKLSRYLAEAQVISQALRASRYKITVFMGSVLSLVLISGTLLYLVESPESGFTSIPKSIYWAIVTLTTVGYGDIAPQTILGQFIASTIMLLGYAIIAVPTGMVTVELSRAQNKGPHLNTISCSHCSREGHDDDARYCKYCGEKL